MSLIGPFSTSPQLVERKSHFVDMMVRDQAEVDALQFWGASTIDDAYGNPTGVTGNSGVGGAGPDAMFTVSRSGQFRSSSIRNRGWSWYGENLRGMSRVAYDPTDFVSTTTGLPSDEQYAFIRVQESRVAAGGFLTVAGAQNNGDPKLGPIYVVPNPEFFGTTIPTLTLQGTAPANTGCTAGSIPVIHPDIQDPNPMHIVLPRTTSSITITNPSAADTLLVSTGLGSTMVAIGPTDDPAVVFGAFKHVVVSGVGATAVAFTIHAVVALGADA